MLSVGPGARRFSPSQNIRVKSELPTDSVMYITDSTTLNWRTIRTGGSSSRWPLSAGHRCAEDTHGQGRTDFQTQNLRPMDGRACRESKEEAALRCRNVSRHRERGQDRIEISKESKRSSRREIRRMLSFTFRRARSRSALFPSRGRKRSSQSMGRGISLARAA